LTEAGVYEIRKQATSGCDTLHTITVEVLEADNSACLSTSTTQISLEKENIRIYPNPTTATLSFQNLPANRYTLSIINNIGLEVYSSELDITDNSSLNVAWLPKGAYFIQMVDTEKTELYQFKFLKIE